MIGSLLPKGFQRLKTSKNIIASCFGSVGEQKKVDALTQASTLAEEEISNILRKKKKKNIMIKIEEEIQDAPETLDQTLAKLQAKKIKPVELKKNEVDATSFESKINAQKSLIDSIMNGLIPMPENIKEFKYGLPIPNIDPEIKGIKEISDQLTVLPNTPTENLYEILKIDGETSYQEFEKALASTYNFSKTLSRGIESDSKVCHCMAKKMTQKPTTING